MYSKDISQYEACIDTQKKLELAKLLCQKIKQIGLRSKYVGSQAAIIAESQIVLLMKITPDDAFDTVKKMMIACITPFYRNKNMLSLSCSLDPGLSIRFRKQRSEWLDFLRNEMENQASLFSESVMVEHQIDVVLNNVWANGSRNLTKDFASIRISAKNFISKYESILTERKKKILVAQSICESEPCLLVLL